MIAFLIVAALAGSPAESLDAAVLDLAALPPEFRQHTRYLSLYNVPLEDRAKTAAAVSYLLNAVSRSRLITRPEVTADKGLLRVNLAAYADLKDPKSYDALRIAWEKLAVADPYWHIRTEVADEHGKIQTVTTDGGWVGLDAAAQLRAMSGSTGAVLRADWFVGQVASTPAYYEWAGVPATEAEFFTALGVDLKAINRLAADSAANMFRSHVTGKPRRVIYKPGPLGAVWITKDAAAETPDKDPIRNPVDFATQRFNFDASEVFYAKANQFWGTALFNAAGARQNAVPPNIATDTTAPAGHQELIPLVSCVRCHEQHGGKAGLQPFSDDQTKLPAPTSAYPAVANRIAELYDPGRLDREMNRSREDYEAAVLAATAMPAAGAVKSFVETFESHVYPPVSPKVAAREVGLPVDVIQAAWAATNDPALIRLGQGGEVNRRTWEASFAEAAVAAESFRNQGN